MIALPAQRLDDVGEYYFSRKLNEIRQMIASGEDVINLGIGSPDLPPSPEVLVQATKALALPHNHGYASSRSLPALRAAMADWYQRTYQVRVKSETEVLPLLGSKEGLYYLAMAFLNPGDHALVPNPGYPAYSSVTRLAGATPIPYDLSAENFWQPDFAKLETLDLSRVKILFANYPHMPTGASAQKGLFEKLVAFGKKHRILICHDNPYGLILNTTPPSSLLVCDPQMEVSVELNSLSKSFNLAGWRVGLMVGHQRVIDTVLMVKSNVDSGMFLPVQAGAIAALASPGRWHGNLNKIYAERRRLVEKIVRAVGFTPAADQVGLFVWAQAPQDVQNVEKRVDEILQEKKIFFTPGSVFGTQGERYLRCSLCSPRDRLQVALERLGGSL